MSSLGVGLIGGWQDVPYDPALFTTPTGSGMIWTVDPSDVRLFQCALMGNIMHVAWDLWGTSLSGTMVPLMYIVVPEGLVPKAKPAITSWANSYWLNHNGSQELSVVSVDSGLPNIHLWRSPMTATPWTPSTNATRVMGNISFEVQL